MNIQLKNKKKAGLVVTGFICILAAAFAGCKDSVKCGPGTVKVNGSCVPELACGPGTVADPESGECVPACSEGEYFDGEQCRPVSECAEGTFFDEVTGTCRPDGTGCAPGTTFDETHMVCRPDVSACGEGTHPDGLGSCVPDQLPEPDVYESEDPELPAYFELPEEGQQISLGGVVDLPTDLNGDGYPDQDWDLFVFSAQAGDHLRIQAVSEGACLPAFIVMSEAQDEDGYSLLYRASVNPHSVENGRDVYLPVDGEYMLWVSDIGPVLGAIFGAGTLPVGGDDFGYFITVERLPHPEFQPLSTLPASRSGSLDSNQLAFFELQNINEKEVFTFTSPGKPLDPAPNDLWSILTVFAPDGRMVLDAWAGGVERDINVFLAADTNGAYKLVQDFVVSTGPAMDYAFSADLLDVKNCNVEDCAVDELSQGEIAVYMWDTVPGDLLLFSAALPDGAGKYLRMDLLSSDLTSLATCSIGEGRNCWRHRYIEQQGWNYLWIRETSGEPVDTFDLNTLHHPIAEVVADTGSGTLPAVLMPPHAPPDGGLVRLNVPAGSVVFADQIWSTMHWSDPAVEFLNTQMSHMGPPLDIQSPDLDSLQTYPLAWPRQDQTLFVRFIDEGADLQNAEWSFTPLVFEPIALGSISGAPIDIPNAELLAEPEIAVFSLEVTNGDVFNILVEPGPGSDLQPEIWLLARGWAYSANWHFSSTSGNLGRAGFAQAGSPGEAAQLDSNAPYTGEVLILVGNIGVTGSEDAFTLSIEAL